MKDPPCERVCIETGWNRTGNQDRCDPPCERVCIETELHHLVVVGVLDPPCERVCIETPRDTAMVPPLRPALRAGLYRNTLAMSRYRPVVDPPCERVCIETINILSLVNRNFDPPCERVCIETIVTLPCHLPGGDPPCERVCIETHYCDLVYTKDRPALRAGLYRNIKASRTVS